MTLFSNFLFFLHKIRYQTQPNLIIETNLQFEALLILHLNVEFLDSKSEEDDNM